MFATGETPMSAITSDWAPIGIDAPVTPATDNNDQVRRREEEFHSALASYMAGYTADQQKRRAAETRSKISARRGYFGIARRFAGWTQSRRFARTSP
jgi:hypothetical protein